MKENYSFKILPKKAGTIDVTTGNEGKGGGTSRKNSLVDENVAQRETQRLLA